MNKGRIISWTTGVSLCIAFTSAYGQSSGPEDKQGPQRILELLSEKERAYIVDPSKTGDLTAEDIEHTKRIQRLHELEVAKDIETEPAGAELVSNQVQPRQEFSEIEDLEMQQQESASIMMRDMARLRAEVMRLNARVQALEMELEGTAESFEEEPAPRFYLPVR